MARALVPDEWQEPGAPRSATDWLVDSLIFTGAVVVGALTLAHIWSHRGVALNVLDLAFGSAACLAFWARRTRPLLVVAFASAAAVFAMAQGAALVAIFNAALRGRPRTIALAAALTVVASITFPLVNPSAGDVFRQRFPGFMLGAIAIGWGLYTRVRRQLILSMRDRARRLQAERQFALEQAREAERRRIAREMHDVLAHRLSLLSIHAGALAFHPDAPPSEIAQAAAVIRAAAADAVADLRQIITVLREDPADATAPPQPTLADLDTLLEQCRAAGMHLQVEIDLADRATLPMTLGRTAYRVVQEGLTNARKHAPGSTVTLSINSSASGPVMIEIRNDQSTRQAPDQLSAPGATAGLVGLAERISLAGGTLSRAADAGQFVLRATLPRTP